MRYLLSRGGLPLFVIDDLSRLLGHLVFEGNSSRVISAENMKCNIDYEFKRHPAITPEIRSLLVGMLRRSPESRLSAQEVVDHVFFEGVAETVGVGEAADDNR